MKRIRLQDVAAKAGVSLATASLALAGKGRISRPVREKVVAAARQLGYQRRGPAAPAGTTVRYVGVLHHQDRAYEWSFVRPFFLQIESALVPRGFVPVLVPVSADSSPEQLYQLITGFGVGALFSIHYSSEELFTRLEDNGVLVVLINNSNLQDKFYSVCVDDFQGAYEGALHLLDLGHRSILYLEYARPEFPAVLSDRFVGFKKALDEHRVAFPPARRITVGFEELAGGLAARLEGVFAAGDRPTAVFGHDDYAAACVVAALRELGLGVPEEVSVIAPGDVLDYSQPFLPQITTMRINTGLMGRLACTLLLDRLRDGSEDIHVLKVKQQLMKRGSCRRRG